MLENGIETSALHQGSGCGVIIFTNMNGKCNSHICEKCSITQLFPLHFPPEYFLQLCWQCRILKKKKKTWEASISKNACLRQNMLLTPCYIISSNVLRTKDRGGCRLCITAFAHPEFIEQKKLHSLLWSMWMNQHSFCLCSFKSSPALHQ